MVLAKTTEADIAYDNNFIVRLPKELLQVLTGVFMKAAQHFAIHPGNANWRILQAFAIWILTHGNENLSDSSLNTGFVDLVYAGSVVVSHAIHRV